MNFSGQEVETVRSSADGEILALIIPEGRGPRGIHFLTEDSQVHQIAVLNWPKDHQIQSHIHNPLERVIFSTQEVLFVRSGRVRLDLYQADQTFECSRELSGGWVVSLISGGHGLEILEDADIIEVKQGPYLGEGEKTRFSPSDNPHLQT